jgi:hypothetical protein
MKLEEKFTGMTCNAFIQNQTFDYLYISTFQPFERGVTLLNKIYFSRHPSFNFERLAVTIL